MNEEKIYHKKITLKLGSILMPYCYWKPIFSQEY